MPVSFVAKAVTVDMSGAGRIAVSPVVSLERDDHRRRHGDVFRRADDHAENHRGWQT